MRIIQAGVGGWGMGWIYAVRDCEGFQHVALIDPNPEALRSAGEVANVPVERQFATVEEAVRSVDADGFLDVSPAPCHEDSTITALRAGLNVLAEKPIADTMIAARAMVDEADRLGRTLMITQQYRYRDQPRCIRRMIADGAIGDIDHVVVEFQIQGLLFGWRQVMRHPFLMDMAIHHFDMMRYLLGRNAVRVQAQTWNPVCSNTEGDMNAFVWAEFEQGVRVNYTGTFAAPGVDTGWNGRWVITGSRGSIVWNTADDWGPIRLFRQDANLSDYSEMHFFTPLPERWGESIWAESIGPQAHSYDLYHWRACIEQHVEPETSGHDNLNTLALTLAAVEAAETGRSVEVARILDESRRTIFA